MSPHYGYQMGMDWTVTSGALATMLEEARKAHPQECCGLLLGEVGGETSTIRMACAAANVASQPLTRFEIDPLALLAAHKSARSGGPQVLGYYHSHPEGHPVPSATDCEHSTQDSRIWAIIAGGEVAFWKDSANGFVQVPCRVTQDDAPGRI